MTLHAGHSKKYTQASSGIAASVCTPQCGQVSLARWFTLPLTVPFAA
jgi:hypothetical protein